jgi:serine/threonine protein kinase
MFNKAIETLNVQVCWNRDTYITIEFSYQQRYKRALDSSNFLKNSYELINRMGSESQNGEVYLNNVPNSVLKVLPKTFDINQNEMKIAGAASHLVLSGSSPHFPLLYDLGVCKNFTGYNHTNIPVHFLVSERASFDLEQYFRRNPNISEEKKHNIKNQCLRAISHMHKYLKVCHNDFLNQTDLCMVATPLLH